MRFLSGTKDIIARLIFCAVNPISSGGSAGTSSPPSNNNKDDQQHLSGFKCDEAENCPILFNFGKSDLNPPDWNDPRLLGEILKTCESLTPTLCDMGAAFNVLTDYYSSYIIAPWWMNYVNCAGTYFVEVEDPLEQKIGRTTELAKCLKERYKNGEGYERVLAVCRWDRYDSEMISMIDSTINECVGLINNSVNEDDIWKFAEQATLQDATDWESKTGVSIYAALFLHQVLKRGGLTKYALKKSIDLQFLEASNQKYFGIRNGAVMEHLHSTVHHNFVVQNHNVVRKDTSAFKDKLLKIMGKEDLSDITFEVNKMWVSWEPNLNVNSRQNLTERIGNIFEGRDIAKMSAREILDAMSRGGLDFEAKALEGEEALDDVKSAGDIVELLFEIRDIELTLFIHATEMIYDKLCNCKGSKHKKYWMDICDDKTSEEAPFDPNDLDHEAARNKHRTLLEKSKEQIDNCEYKDTVFVTLVDRMRASYPNDDTLKKLITTEFEFHPIHHFGHVIVYARFNEDKNSMALIFLHHAFSKAFTSVPHGADLGRVFGDKKVEEHSITAVTFHWIQGVLWTMLKIKGTEDFKPVDELLGTMLPSFAAKMNSNFRWHVGCSMVAVAVEKDMFAPEEDYLQTKCHITKYGLRKKYYNRKDRGEHGFEIAEKVCNVLSLLMKEDEGTEREKDIVDKAYSLILTRDDGVERVNEDGTADRGARAIIDAIPRKYIRPNTRLIQLIEVRHKQEKDRRVEEAAKKKEENEKKRAKLLNDNDAEDIDDDIFDQFNSK